MRIAIIGGGLSGLTLAYYLQQRGVAYDLFEAGARPGGNLLSPLTPEGYQLEAGPNSLLLSAELLELITELGLEDAIQDAAPVSQQRFVLRGGQFRALPGSPPALLASGFFSLRTKLRLLSELARRPAEPVPGETVAAFFGRHFGPEVVEYAVRPFVAGIYAGDPSELLLSLTFPRLAELEREYGSLLRGLARGPKAVRRRTITLRGGVQTLTDALSARLRNLHLGRTVKAIRAVAGGYELDIADLEGAAQSTRQLSDGPAEAYPIFHDGPAEASPAYSTVALAMPTYVAAELLRPLTLPGALAAADALAAVRYPPLTLVYSAYDRAQVAHPLAGFGALHPPAEGTYAAGAIWTSSIFPDRVPAGQVLLTSFVGGAQFAEAAGQPAEQQLAAVHTELTRLYGISGAPRWQGRYHWARSIPQFDQHLAAARAAVAPLAAHGLVAAANWQAGVSVPDCVKYAKGLAERLATGQGVG